MRISDWSSDVCSSDLRCGEIHTVQLRRGDDLGFALIRDCGVFIMVDDYMALKPVHFTRQSLGRREIGGGRLCLATRMIVRHVIAGRTKALPVRFDAGWHVGGEDDRGRERKSTRLNPSH